MRCMDNRTGRQEEETLEDGMIEGMEEGGEQADQGKIKKLVTGEDYIQADTHEDDAGVLDAAVREHGLDVILL